MTGPEHYQYAEELLDMAGNDAMGSDIERYHLAKAQVHATLALTAATALASHDAYDSPDHRAWHDAASLAGPEDPDGGEA